jgi:hypothetical protein
MWWRVVGSAVEHASRCLAPDQALDFGSLFLDQEAEDEDATSLAEMLHALDLAMADRDAALGCRKRPFKASDVAEMINRNELDGNALVVRGFLFPNLASGVAAAARAVGKRLKAHIGEPVNYCGQTLTLKGAVDTHDNVLKFHVAGGDGAAPHPNRMRDDDILDF